MFPDKMKKTFSTHQRVANSPQLSPELAVNLQDDLLSDAPQFVPVPDCLVQNHLLHVGKQNIFMKHSHKKIYKKNTQKKHDNKRQVSMFHVSLLLEEKQMLGQLHLNWNL